jgi:hypothetical protein
VTAAGWIALAITVFGAFGYAGASILQAVAAKRSTSLARTLSHPLYLTGIALDVLAWAGSMVALRELAVYLVESILAGSLAITVLAARFVLKSKLRKRDVACVIVSISALTVLALSAGPQEGTPASAGLRWGLCTAAVLLTLLGRSAARTCPPGLVAAMGGLCLGGAALSGRALHLPEQAMGHPGALALAIVSEPLTWAVLIFAANGMLLYANALQRGQVGQVTAVHWIAEVTAPSAVALLLLGDSVRPGWGLVAIGAGVVTIGAAVLLATAPATGAAVRPPDALPDEPSQPSLPVSAPIRYAERIIWWGSPPVWTPPNRERVVALPTHHAPELTWTPPPRVQALWSDPHRPDADADEIPAEPVTLSELWPILLREEDRPEPVRSRQEQPRHGPWDDL